MDVSMESAAQTEKRLRQVISRAEFEASSKAWFWDEATTETRPDTIALVRDQNSQSQLVPVGPHDRPLESVGLFSFHFPNGADNSGFVGWLATHIKQHTGSGVFVVCGSNQSRGGIYDYWACPIDVLEEVVELISALRGQGWGSGSDDGGTQRWHGTRPSSE